MTLTVGIDPGKEQSGVVCWDGPAARVEWSRVYQNIELIYLLRKLSNSILVGIERIRGYGIVAGDDTFDTCEWVGSFKEAHEAHGGRVKLIPRKDIKRHICGNTTTNDKYIRAALIDRFGVQGTKKNPGTLYGISGHLWAALAVAVYCEDIMRIDHTAIPHKRRAGLEEL